MGLELCILPKTTPYGANLNPWTSHQEHSTIHRKPLSQDIKTPGQQPLPRPLRPSIFLNPPLSTLLPLPSSKGLPRVVSPRSENSTRPKSSSSSNSNSNSSS